MLRRTSHYVCLAIVTTACDSVGSVQETRGRLRESAFWDTLAVVGTFNDTTVGAPDILRAGLDHIAVSDAQFKHISLYSCSGDRHWTTGREGHGPGEFLHIRDMIVGDEGLIRVLDIGNGRVTYLDANGIHVDDEAISMQGQPDHLVPTPRDVGIAFAEGSVRGIIAVENGRRDTTQLYPSDEYSEYSSLATQGFTDKDGLRWVYAFAFGDKWLGYNGTELDGSEGLYPGGGSFPEVVTSEDGMSRRLAASPGDLSAFDVALAGDSVFVLAAGEEPDRGRVVDMYDFGDGEYLGSVKLPFRAARIARCKAAWVFVVAEPYPRLFFVTRRGARDS